jgi:translation initiation factor IF-3
VPVPRKFDRRPPERDLTRINDRIRVPEVRLVGEDGKQIGVIKTSEALAYAQQRDLDLVEVAPEARPPVCRVLDYSKYKYEQAQKLKAARRHQQQITIREIKFRPKIAQNDYDTKKGHITRFLLGKDKVKVTIMFRGREVTHPERGTALLDRLAGELSELAVVEQSPIQDGRNMTMMLAPSKAVLAGEKDHHHDDSDDHSETRGKGSRRDRARAEAEAQADGSNGSHRNGSGSEPSDDAEAEPEAEAEVEVEAEPAASPTVASDEADG